MKSFFLSALLFLTALAGGPVFAQDAPAPQEKKHGFCFDLGLGWSPLTSYPSGLQSAIDEIRDLPSISEVDINLNLDIGYCIFESPSSNLYLTAGIDAYAPRFQDSSGSFQINNYIYGIGFQSVSGNLLSRVNFGLAKAVEELSGSGVTYTGVSDSGFGLATKIGWDFNPNGIGLWAGVNAFLSVIDGDLYSSVGLALSLTYL